MPDLIPISSFLFILHQNGFPGLCREELQKVISWEKGRERERERGREREKEGDREVERGEEREKRRKG